MSTLYGSDAMGGVVNLITRKVGTHWLGKVGAESTVQGNGDFGNIQSLNGYAQGPVVRDLIGLSVLGILYHRDASALKYENVAGALVPLSTRGPSPVKADIYTYGGRISVTPIPYHDLWIEYDRS